MYLLSISGKVTQKKREKQFFVVLKSLINDI